MFFITVLSLLLPVVVLLLLKKNIYCVYIVYVLGGLIAHDLLLHSCVYVNVEVINDGIGLKSLILVADLHNSKCSHKIVRG